MSKKKNTIIIGICLILLIIIVSFLFLYNSYGLKKVSYNDVFKMMENNESFVLCISRTTCSHCDNYKPKLENIAKENKIKIYYIDIDKESEENQDNFKNIITFNDETPMTVFIKDGKESTTANRISGDVSEKKILEKLKTNKFI